MIPLHKITGANLVEAYTLLNPEEADFMAPMAAPFQAWLDTLRDGRLEHELSLKANFTAKKTRALLLLLDCPEPDDMADLLYLTGLKQATPSAILKARMQRRADRLRGGDDRLKGGEAM